MQTSNAFLNRDQDWFRQLEESLPVMLTRKTASEAIGGLFSPRTLSNFNAKGQGPRKRRIGNKVVYRRDDFINWLRDRVASEDLPFSGFSGR